MGAIGRGESDADSCFLRTYLTSRLVAISSFATICMLFEPSVAQFGLILTQSSALVVLALTEVVLILLSKWITGNKTVLKVRFRQEQHSFLPQNFKRARFPSVSRGLRSLRSCLEPFFQMTTVLCYFLLVNMVLLYLSICFGAPHNNWTTFNFSLLLNALTTLPVFLVFLDDKDSLVQVLRGTEAYLNTSQKDSRGFLVDHLSKLCLGPLLGAWFGAFPIPLDWDRDWQEWPITCSLGALMGTILAICYELVALSSFGKKFERGNVALKKGS